VLRRRSKSLLLLLAASMLAQLYMGCGGGGGGGGDNQEDWGIPVPTMTGVDPLIGEYSFNQRGCFSVTKDSTSGVKAVVFASDCSRFDRITVEGGAFYFTHGEVGGTDCPTDAYAISGSFISATRAEGIIRYGSGCDIREEANFIAQHK